jgi:hypothetical protein
MDPLYRGIRFGSMDVIIVEQDDLLAGVILDALSGRRV